MTVVLCVATKFLLWIYIEKCAKQQRKIVKTKREKVTPNARSRIHTHTLTIYLKEKQWYPYLVNHGMFGLSIYQQHRFHPFPSLFLCFFLYFGFSFFSFLLLLLHLFNVFSMVFGRSFSVYLFLSSIFSIRFSRFSYSIFFLSLILCLCLFFSDAQNFLQFCFLFNEIYLLFTGPAFIAWNLN